MLEAADADNEIKIHFGAHDNDDQMQRKVRSKHVNYFMKYLWQKY